MNEEHHSFTTRLVVGGISAALSKTLVAPLDRIKLIIQNQDSNIQIQSGQLKRYNGFLDVFMRVPREQGFFSFWRGNFSNIIRYFPTQAINFAAYNWWDEHLAVFFHSHLWGEDSHDLAFILRKLSAGAIAGAISSIVVHPLNFCQTRISSDLGGTKSQVEREFHSYFACMKRVVNIDGVKGLYGGYVAATIGVAYYRGLYFGLYDLGKIYLMPYYGIRVPEHTHPILPVSIVFILAQTATIVSGTMSYPLDTVSRRMMLQAGKPSEYRQYIDTLDCITKLYKSGGIQEFFRGGVSNCIRSLGGALVLVFYEQILQFLAPD